MPGPGVVPGVAWYKDVTETLTITDYTGNQPSISRSEPLSLADTIVKGIAINKTESASLADVLDKSTTKNSTESLALTDHITEAFAKSLTESLTLSDSRSAAFSKAILESLTLADAVSLVSVVIWLVAVTETLKLTDSIDKFPRYYGKLVNMLSKILNDDVTKDDDYC